MELSRGEKLTLVMLSEIYEKLGVSGELEPKIIRKAIFTDNLWGLRWRHANWLNDEPMPKVVQDVCDILDMWWILEAAYDRLTEEEKATLEISDPVDGNLQFNGFDRDTEGEHLKVARFFIEDLGHFSEFSGRDLNGHTQVVDRYLKMFAAFTPKRGALEHRELTLSDLTDILNA